LISVLREVQRATYPEFLTTLLIIKKRVVYKFTLVNFLVCNPFIICTIVISVPPCIPLLINEMFSSWQRLHAELKGLLRLIPFVVISPKGGLGLLDKFKIEGHREADGPWLRVPVLDPD
jgi:hypothetical protein